MTTVTNLSIRLLELQVRIDEEDDDARRSLSEAVHQFNTLARTILPESVIPVDEDKDETGQGSESDR
jgi:hypothetical protein